jgi:hypothetical protein
MFDPPFTSPLALISALPLMYVAQQQQATSPSGAPWHDLWDQQSLANSFNTMTLQTPLLLMKRVTDFGVLNHTTPDPSNISLFRPPNSPIPSSIVVGNGFVLHVTSVGDTVHPGPFYLNNVLVTIDIIKNLLSVRQFTTNN